MNDDRRQIPPSDPQPPTELLAQGVPIGTVVPYAGQVNDKTQPTLEADGWLPCDGRQVSRDKFHDLLLCINDTYRAAGLQAGNFNLPNLVGRVALGAVTGQTVEYTDPKNDPHTTSFVPKLGERAGAATLTSDALPHIHQVNGRTGSHDQGTFKPARALGDTAGVHHTHDINLPTDGPALGSGQQHRVLNSLQPYLVLNFLIRFRR